VSELPRPVGRVIRCLAVDELPLEIRGSEPPTRGPVVSLGSPRRPGRFIVAALVVVAALAVAIGSHRSSGRALPTTTPSAPRTPDTTARATTTSSIVATTAPTPLVPPGRTLAERTITTGDGPMLASLTHTELIASGVDAVLRIDLDRGTVTRTLLPQFQSTGPMFLVAGPTSVLVRPMDNVNGYLVPDGSGPMLPPGRLAEGTAWAYPGPMPDSVWISRISNGDPNALELVSFDAVIAMTVPLDNVHPWGPDGTGQVVLVGLGGAYVTGPNGLTRVTTGDVFAAGPTKWLVRECDDRHVCTIATIDRGDGHRGAELSLGYFPSVPSPLAGVVSADGLSAAAMRRSGELDVIDLSSGEQRNVATSASRVAQVAPVWSLDSRFLFFATANSELAAFDRVTGMSSVIYVEDQQVAALAVRPAA
jgi:hypothetical protein